MSIPPLPNTRRFNPSYVTVFGGLNETPSADGFTIADACNLTTDYYPVLAARNPYGEHRSIANCNGYGVADAEYWVSGTGFYYNGVQRGTVSDSRKHFAVMGSRIIIFPDQKIYDWSKDISGASASDYFYQMSSLTSASGTVFKDGTLFGVAAIKNTVKMSGKTFSDFFEVGDGVTISGCTGSLEGNNITAIIREINGDELHFDENIFTNGTQQSTVSVSRNIPDMDYICVNENRLWGCKGDEIYASALGNPCNFNALGTGNADSWAASVEDTGDFTGCISYLGYPIFFKRDLIYKVYGSTPATFGWQSTARMGVLEGCSETLAIVDGTLFYLSPYGVCAYRGAAPQVVSASLGDKQWHGAAGGGTTKYYISMYSEWSYVTSGNGTYKFTLNNVTRSFSTLDIDIGTKLVFDGMRLYKVIDTVRHEIPYSVENTGTEVTFLPDYKLYCYDPVKGLWMRESFCGTSDMVGGFAILSGSPVALNSGKIVSLDGRIGTRKTGEWYCRFGDHTNYYTSGKGGSEAFKGLGKLRVRYEGSMDIYLSWDSGDYAKAFTLDSDGKESDTIPLTLRRCDHYALMIKGSIQLTGCSKVYQISASQYAGSDRR